MIHYSLETAREEWCFWSKWVTDHGRADLVEQYDPGMTKSKYEVYDAAVQLKETFQVGCPHAETFPDTISDDEYSGNGGVIDLSYEVACCSRCLKVVEPERSNRSM